MERLNNIMSRTTQQRRQQAPAMPEQRRSGQQQMRRPLSGQDQRGSAYQQRPRPNPRVSENSTYDYPQQPGYQPPIYDGGDDAPGYHPAAPSQPARRYPQDTQDRSEERDIYYGRYTPAPDADAQEQWNDDVASMAYGDWEDEEVVDLSPYPRELAKQPQAHFGHQSTAEAFAAQNHGLLTTRQLTRVDEQEFDPMPLAPRSPLTHVNRKQPTTQPLVPQNSSYMRQELPQPVSPSQETPRTQQPSRLAEVRSPRQTRTPASTPQQAYLSVPPPLPPKQACPKCKGAGYLRLDVPVGHPSFGKPVPCECKEAEWREKRRQELLELSDLGAFVNKSFANFNRRFSGMHPSVEEAYQASLEFAKDPHGWLLLVGPNGCGKTHMAAAIANTRFQQGAVVLFAVVPDLLAHLRATFSSTATEAYEQRFAKMRESEILVLDDLGAHQSSPWASEKLFQLLNYRYNSEFPTVITANEQGLLSLDERIFSRLHDRALVVEVQMNGARDYRRQNSRREQLR